MKTIDLTLSCRKSCMNMNDKKNLKPENRMHSDDRLHLPHPEPSRKSLLLKRVFWTAASIAVMVMVFFFSSQSGSESSSVSGRFLFLLTWIMSESQASFLIRKGAHFSIYLVLGFCLFGAFFPQSLRSEPLQKAAESRVFSIHPKSALAYAAACAFLYACSDEWHQTFSDSRSGQFSDVLLDTAGAFCGALLHLGLKKLCLHVHEQKNG